MKKSDDAIRELMSRGWVLKRQKGSHRQYKHPDFPDLITVAHPSVIPIGTWYQIMRKAGMK